MGVDASAKKRTEIRMRNRVDMMDAQRMGWVDIAVGWGDRAYQTDRRLGGRFVSKQFGEGLSWVGGAHEVFADECDVEAGVTEGLEVLAGFDSRFGDEVDVWWDAWFEFDGVVEVGGHGGEVSVVDAEEDAFVWGGFEDGEDALKVCLGVDFEEGGHVEFVDLFDERGDLGVCEALGDEEDGVGLDGAGLGDLVGVDDEVFAEDWEIDGLFDLGDEVWVASEELLVGEA